MIEKRKERKSFPEIVEKKE